MKVFAIPAHTFILKTPNTEGDTISVARLLDKISLGDKKSELAVLDRMMKETENETGFDRFLILRHFAKIQPQNNQYWLDSCIKFAVLNGHLSYLNTLYILKSTFFISGNQSDSAMIYTLKARDESILDNNIEQIANATHLLGDLYFGTGFYPQARKYYEEVQKLKGEPKVWKSWRERVIRNNIGLLEYQQKNYLSGLKIFMISRSEQGEPQNKNDSSAVAYILSSLAQGFYYTNKLKMSQLFLDSAVLYNRTLNDRSGLAENYLLQAKLHLKGNNSELTSQVLQRFNELTTGDKLSSSIQLGLLAIKSDIAEKRGDLQLALQYQKQYSHLNDSVLKARKAAQILQLQTEHEYEGLNSQLKQEKRDKLALFIILLFTGVSLIIMTLQYIKIQNKNRKLVSLTLKTIPDKSSFTTKPEDDSFSCNKSGLAPDTDIYDIVLFQKIQEVMENKKLYLLPVCSLEKLANLLGSNRTYTSKAINACYGQNYSAFINSLRIKEALQIIKDDTERSLTIEAIAFKVGFSNRTSFISAFFKEVGMLPSSFISNLKFIRNAK